ncbi:MAG: hypothetical protein M1275_00490 [Patescibacteria group bacterium]|nr:hypothetical protein [Patescibacteria group bacterium]
MRAVWLGVIFILMLCLATSVFANETGTIDSGGVVVQRQVEQGSVKGALLNRLVKLSGGRYWTAVSAVAIFSLLIFEAGWKLGQNPPKDRAA